MSSASQTESRSVSFPQSLRGVRHAFVAIAALSGLLNVLTLAGSFFMLLVYDRVLPSHSQETLVGLVILVGVVYLFQALLDMTRSGILIAIGRSFDGAWAARVYDAVRLLPLQTRVTGDSLQAVRDLDLIRAFVSGPGPMALFDLPWIFLYLGICFAFHWMIGAAALAGAAVMILLTLLTEVVSRGPTREATRLGAQRLHFAGMGAQNAEAIQALGMGGRLRDTWSRINREYSDGQARAATLTGGLGAFTRVFRMFLQSGVLAIGAYLVINQKSTGGVIIASSILTSRALAPVELAIAHWKGFVAARQAWPRLSQVLAKGAVREVHTQLAPPTKSLSVEALTLVPPGSDRPSIQDVSFSLSAGDGLGIIGPSGGGKSSLVRGLVGSWSPVRGAVRLDGAAMDQRHPDELGGHVGYVPQSVELISGTIGENISRFEPDADSELIIRAAEFADVHNLIVRLPQGYDTPVGLSGSNLSAGQRQRIALARALYRDPFLIVLDEPNSNLDVEGDMALARAVAAARARGAIVIVVAHRPSALEPLDQVMLVANGRMQIVGPKAEVLSKINPGQQPHPQQSGGVQLPQSLRSS